jgi:hypothetical protein
MPGNVYWGLHGALAKSANPAVMLIGDSWFWYPFDNLAAELGSLLPQQEFLVVGNNGSEAAEWATKYRKDIDYAFRFYGKSVDALMLSGGGNDVAGMKDFLRIVNDACKGAKKVADCYRPSEPGYLMAMLMGHYRALITKFRGYNTRAPVVLHQYDYAWPTGTGVFGPADWLKEPMAKAQVPVALRRDLFRDLINQLRDAQLELAKDTTLGPVFVAKTAGTLPENKYVWANELHPTPEGFRKIASGPLLQALKAALA